MDKLRGLQHQMLRKMIGVRPRSDESKQDFMVRVNSRLKHLKVVHEIVPWDRVYHNSVFSWAGHLARMKQYCPDRETHKVLMHKCWAWIQKIAEDNAGSQLHGRRLRIWRWERPLYKFFSDSSWMAEAQDKSSWTSQLESMVEWRCSVR